MLHFFTTTGGFSNVSHFFISFSHFPHLHFISNENSGLVILLQKDDETTVDMMWLFNFVFYTKQLLWDWFMCEQLMKIPTKHKVTKPA